MHTVTGVVKIHKEER